MNLRIVKLIAVSFLLGILCVAGLAALPQSQDFYQRVANLENAMWGGPLIGGGNPTMANAALTTPTLTNPVISSTSVSATFCPVPVGSVAYGSFGTGATGSTGQLELISLDIPRNSTITGIQPLWGAANGTNTAIVALYNSAGVLVANSATGGTATAGGANTFQKIPFTAPVNVTGPSKFTVGLQLNGFTDSWRGVASNTFLNVQAGVVGGTSGTVPPTITGPTGSTGGVIACTY